MGCMSGIVQSRKIYRMPNTGILLQGLWNRVRANAHAVTLKISTPGNQRNKPRSQQQYDESVYCIKYRLHAAKQSHLYIFDLKVQDLNPCIRK
jgi:hypothetical protein